VSSYARTQADRYYSSLPTGPPTKKEEPTDPLHQTTSCRRFVTDVCGCFPGCEQFEALSPDEIKTGECMCCLGVLPACNDVYPIWGRVGPRIFRHPHLGEMHFNGTNKMHDTCHCKIC